LCVELPPPDFLFILKSFRFCKGNNCMGVPKILIALAGIALLGRVREYSQLKGSEGSSLKKRALTTLDILGVGGPVRRVNRFWQRSVRKADKAIRARKLSGWTPMIPEEHFEACCRNAIQLLRTENPNHHFGDYLEFGVSRGTSLACMHRALQSEGLPNVRLLGFDSFEGLPLEAKAEGWAPGAFYSTLATTERYLKSRGVDVKRVVLTKGWFKDTLTDKTRQRLGITNTSLIMIDCDIYSAARKALWFCEPFIQDRAVIFFDDWASRSVEHNVGEKEAFKEFLDAFPSFHAQPLSSYAPNARVFLLTRRESTTGIEHPAL
jgi:O-methyltransferase